MPSTFLRSRPVVVTAALVLIVSSAGCGRRMYPVSGTVTLEDGRALTRGMVIFEGQHDGVAIMARGQIKSDGSYQLSTERPGDGVPPGKYRVQINPMDLSEVPDEKKNLPFDIKYLRFSTSGLEYEVKAGPNEFPIQLSRPSRRR